MRFMIFRDGLPWPWFIFLPSISVAVILSGSPQSYARYPKWAHSYENSLSLELKTKQSNGLLLYTDDGGIAGNFYSISISDGRIQLDFRLGDRGSDFGQRRPITTIRIEEVRVDDDRWHSLRVHQSFENVKLELDYTLVFKILNQRSFVFGNIQKNSDVFVGGLPKDVHQLPILSSPLRRHSRHLAVNVRNLVYRLYPQGETSPQLLDGNGIRHNEDDYCRPSGFSSREIFSCQHGGRCYSKADGPGCDCTMSDHEGKHCEIEKVDAELTFSGHEWLGYDVSANVSAMVRAKRENLTMAFKTVHGTAMLFYAGDDKSYLHLMLDQGALIATSKFEGTDPRLIRMFNSYPGERYDDDSWHIVVLERTLQMHSEKIAAVHMTLIVDGRRDEIRQYAPELDWISNNHAFLGGIPTGRTAHGVARNPFRGCMKLVQYEADAIQVQFVNLADQGYGQSVIRSGGELSYSCKNPFQHADVINFDPTASALVLPSINTDPKGGSLSFSFRAAEPDGLVFYHGALTDNSSEFIAFELLDGHLFMIIDLGAGPVRLQTTAKKVTEGNDWHSVYMERLRRTGSVVVDQQKTDFSTPGTSANLDVADPVYIGGIPSSSIVFPSSVWTINLRKGFVGCIKNVRFNGLSAKIANVLENSNATGVSLGCPVQAPGTKCHPNPCQNYGVCTEGLLSFHCDCYAVNKEGPTCNLDLTIVDLDGEKSTLSILPKAVMSEAEDISVRFRSESSRGTILETRSVRKTRDRITLQIEGKELKLQIETDRYNHSFSWGNDAADGRWHTAQVKRRGNHLLLNWDGKWGKSYYLPYSVVVEMDEMTGGRSLRPDDLQDPPFKGQMTKLTLNGVDILEKSKKEGRSSKESKGQRNIKSKQGAVSFTNTTGYVLYSPTKISSLTGQFRVSFKFQTLIKTAILFTTVPGETSDNLLLQLVNGRVRFSLHNRGEDIQMTSPRVSGSQQLSDMRWHAILVYQDPKTKDYMMLVDNTSVIAASESKKELKLSATVVLGGLPKTIPSRGFRGCMSTLRINDRPVDILDEADEKAEVLQGCAGPIARCSPAACSNGGRCVQQWHAIRCDCTLTAHSGDRCQEPGTTVAFMGEPSAVYYEYPVGEMPSSSQDYLVLAFKTIQTNGVLFSVESAADEDFLTVYLDGGYVQMRYNLGSREHHVGYFSQKVNDGKIHILKILRHHVKSTLQLDRGPAVRYSPKSAGDELVTLNMHWRLSIGAAFNAKHIQHDQKLRRRSIKLFDPFQGEISGVNFNGVHILQLYAEGSPRVFSIGPVQKTVIAQAPSSSIGEDVMIGEENQENVSDALIESLGASCLSEEERQTCFVDTDESGFFTPVLPSTAPQTRRVTPAVAHGEWSESTTQAAPPVIFLSELDELLEGSAQPPEMLTPATKPLSTSTTPPTTTTTTTVKTTTSTLKPTSKVTVLPRPYESVSIAAELNPEYLGESIWAEVDLLPEPLVTGPAWRTRNTTTASPATEATTAKKTPPLRKTTRVTAPSRRMTTSTTTTESTTRRRTTSTSSPSWITTDRSTPAITFSTLLSTSTKLSAKVKTTPPYSVYPVRPTTPMGDVVTTTIKYATTTDGEFPRTAMVMICSLAVIFVIVAIVVCVFFRCHTKTSQGGEHYAMAVNGKASGYAPISAELSPPLGIDPSTQPLLPRQAPQVKGGYQPLNGAVVPNGNGVARTGNGIVKNGVAKKKDFKEWYV